MDKPKPERESLADCPQFLSIPVWDITDEEISEWKESRSGVIGVRLAGYTAAAIRDGRYDNGRELYPREPAGDREVPQRTIDLAMGMLMERGMTRRSGGSWYPVVPGRMEPSTWRAVGTLLARRDELPPALVAELDSWKLALRALNAPAVPPSSPPSAPALAVAG